MKTFLLDTNIFLVDPACLKSFKNNEIVIPLSVIDELDEAKNRPDAIGRNAREAIRILDVLRKKGNISKGVSLEDTLIRVELNHSDNIPSMLSDKKKDNRFISTALGLKREGSKVIVITKDINLRVKCDALGLEAEDYETDKIAKNPSDIYSGIREEFVSQETVDKLYKEEDGIEGFEGFPNEFILLKTEHNNCVGLGRIVGDKLKKYNNIKKICGISPRNLEQKIAFELLMDPDVKLVTLVGLAGSGKTVMAAAAGLHHILSQGNTYQKLLISRPIQPMGRDLGYLPGDIDQKLDPWMQPIYDNFELLLGNSRENLRMYKEQRLIQVEPLTYVRGRSIPKAFIILDEAQNLSINEIKTIVSRAGEDTKIVITGDIEQIDNPYVDFADNGLTHVVERFKDYGIAGHIMLQKCERSKLAELAAKVL